MGFFDYLLKQLFGLAFTLAITVIAINYTIGFETIKDNATVLREAMDILKTGL